MNYRLILPALISSLLIFVACHAQKPSSEKQAPKTETTKKAEPHRYGGWYCPDNFGFVPVDIQKLNEVPAIANRLPTQEELENNMSLINVDTKKHPDARALKMDLPRVARIYSEQKEMHELVIVIQAIVVQEDTVVGYRFPSGGNGSAWMQDVTFLSKDEVTQLGSQPFFYSKTTIKASKEEIWKAMRQTPYFKELGEKFNKQNFFSSDWTAESEAHLGLTTFSEKATGFVATLFGNAYLQIDYQKFGAHFSEKILMIENHEENTTDFFVANGPYAGDFISKKQQWDNWVNDVKSTSERNGFITPVNR